MLLNPITEDEMIALYLKGEVNSDRFGQLILEALTSDGVEREIIDSPDWNDASTSQYRRKLLGRLRGFGEDRLLFTGFPLDMKWFRASLTSDEVKKVQYINYDYWVQLSNGSRLPREAAKNIHKGVTAFSQSNNGFLRAAEAIFWHSNEGVKAAASAVQEHTAFPEMIFVGSGVDEKLVVLEGHLRLTAYLLAESAMPEALTAIVGYSPKITSWELY